MLNTLDAIEYIVPIVVDKKSEHDKQNNESVNMHGKEDDEENEAPLLFSWDEFFEIFLFLRKRYFQSVVLKLRQMRSLMRMKLHQRFQ